jgi:hypothetical protein
MWTTLWVSLLVVATVAVFFAFGTWRWRRATEALRARLCAAAPIRRPGRYIGNRELDGLPVPVRRYFHAVLQEGQPIVVEVRIEHVGRFNISKGGEHWRPFVSTQHVMAARPGFA